MAGDGDESPADRDVGAVRSSARQELRAIGAAIDAADELLFAHPDPATWDDAQRSAWLTRRNELAGLCGHSAPAP